MDLHLFIYSKTKVIVMNADIWQKINAETGGEGIGKNFPVARAAVTRAVTKRSWVTPRRHRSLSATITIIHSLPCPTSTLTFTVVSPILIKNGLTRLNFFVDLYGNDEAADEQPQQENEAQLAADHEHADTPALKTDATTEVSSKPAPSTVEKTHTNAPPTQAPISNGAPIASYTQQAPQQIPTYEQPLTNDYRETPAPRADGGYQNIPVTERSIRPSEMKDEG